MNLSRPPLNRQRLIAVCSALTAMLVAVCIVALSVGSVQIPLQQVLGALTGGSEVPESARTIVLSIRLPRVILALVVGAGLSVAGVVFQALLRNPLAEPYVLGISSGGTVGALAALLLALPPLILTLPAASFCGSAAVMLIVYAIGQRRGQLDTHALLLGGIMVGAFFNAVVLLVLALARQEMGNALLWLMGNLGVASISSIAIVSPLVLVSCGLLFVQGKKYNLVSTGDEAALQLGVDVRTLRRLSYFLASLLTGVVVSVSGVIGFVGLIVPHTCRLLFGPDHRILLPSAFLLGGGFLVAADILSRVLLAPSEIPVGAITSAIGAPLFIVLLRRS